MVSVPEGTIVVFADIGCPWAHLCVYRLHRARAAAGLEDLVVVETRPFPLEIVNAQPTPKKILDAEIPVAGALDTGAGWRMWQRPDYEYPVTTLPALEAVEAAKQQGPRVAEALDRALRVAFFRDGRTISLRHEISDVAATVPGLDRDRLREALDSGAARAALMEHCRVAESDAVTGSPHVFLPDGSDVHNPGVEFEWHGEHGEGFPIVKDDDPSVFERIVERGAGRG